MCDRLNIGLGLLISVAVLIVAPPTLAQTCAHGWLAGPLDNGTAPNGTNQPDKYDAPVTALASWDPEGDGAPMLVAAGTFTNVQGVTAYGVAARNSVTGLWQPLNTPSSSCVPASLVVYNGSLIYGGSACWSAPLVGRWNGTTWEPLGGNLPVDGSSSNKVRAFAVYNGNLYAAGTFSSDANSIYHIARWNGSTWSPLGSGIYPDAGGTVRVYAMAVYNGELIVAGDFEGAGGLFSPNIARWNGSAWLPLVGPTYTSAQFISALTVYNGELIAGGFFVSAGTQAVHNIARWNGSTWNPLGSGMDDSVTELRVYNGKLIAVGEFSTAGGLAANRIAQWNGAIWYPLDQGLDEPTSVFHQYALCVIGSELVVGGSFSTAGDASANNLARWYSPNNSFGDWTSFGGGVAYSVNALAPLGARIAIGGDFSQSVNAGPAAYNIATWDGQTLSEVAGSVNDSVYSLKSFNTTSTNYLVVGGGFTQVGSQGGIDGIAGGSAISANRIAMWSDAFFNGGWSAMGTGFNNTVLAIDRVPANQFLADLIIAGGEFTASGTGSPAFNRIATWSGSSGPWASLGTGFNNRVRAIKAFNTSNVNRLIYAGGDFTTADGEAANRIAYWPIFNLNGWEPMGNGFNNSVYAIERHNGFIYAGGAFTASGAAPINHVARWSGTVWENVGLGLNGTVFALSSIGGYLYATSAAAGGFSVAKWDGTSWTAVDGGVTGGFGFALSPFKTELIVGGLFSAAQSGAVATPDVARYRLQGVPWIVKQPVSQTMACGWTANFIVDICSGYQTGAQYQWSKDGVPLSEGWTGTGSFRIGTNNTDLGIYDPSEADEGTYQLVITNSCGTVTSTAVALAVTGACPPCPLDIAPPLVGNGVVNIDDLVMLITSWGTCSLPPPTCRADVAPPGGNGVVNIDDLVTIITSWGSCP